MFTIVSSLCLPALGASATNDRSSQGDLLVMSFNIRDGNRRRNWFPSLNVVIRCNVGTVDTVIRYNISQNDGARIFHISGLVSGTRIDNNLFFVAWASCP